MPKAVERIRRAIASGERIAVFGDYDCDGITAAAQLVRFFRRNGTEPLVRLPDRVQDGYGLSMAIVEEMRNAHVTLLITCDTGITASNEIAALADLGIETIVTDHHRVSEELPPAYALLHPALCGHPVPHPSGAGVVFKLLSGLENGHWEDMQTDLALAMLGTVADLVELKGDNRTIVTAGLRALDALRSGPLAVLRDRCRSTDKPLSSTDVAFRIAPRINAAGRMQSPVIALHALLEGGEHLATLDALNTERQEQTAQFLEHITGDIGTVPPPFIVRADAQYPHGLLGLLSGKLTETYGRPSMVATITGETCTASLRSPACYNVTEALGRCAHLLMRFGGHAQAAGCTFRSSNLNALESALLEDVEQRIAREMLVPSLTLDAEIQTTDISPDFVRRISVLEPFGQGNPEPKFLLRNVSITAPRTVGSDGTHLQGVMDGVSCIGFNLGSLAEKCQNIDVVARIGMNTWNGSIRPQIVMEDMRLTIRDL